MNHSSCRNNRLHFVILTLTTAILLAGTALAQGTFVSFDGPNSGTASGTGTFPAAIGRWGGVALTTTGESGTTQAYVRRPNGTYLQIQPPGATATYISGINAHGQVAGSFNGASGQVGYVRNADGTYVILNPPGSTGQTSVAGINDAGQVAGNAYVTGGVTPFFWDPAHPDTYVTFSVPGGTSPYAAGINASGQIAGSYGAGCCQTRGFLRNSDGTLSTFIIAGNFQLRVSAINKWGTIIGSSFDENSSSTDLFLRYSGGGKRTIGGSSHGGLEPAAISDNGVVVGTDFGGDTSYGNAFSVDRSHTVTLIPVPFTSQGSTANGVNSVGQIVGSYIDANGASHGWIYLP